MRKIRYSLEIGFAGCQDEGVMEVDDEISEQEIEDVLNEMALNWASGWEGDERLFSEEEWEEEGASENFYENVYASFEFIPLDEEF